MVNGAEIYVLNLLTFREAKWRKEKNKRKKFLEGVTTPCLQALQKGVGCLLLHITNNIKRKKDT